MIRRSIRYCINIVLLYLLYVIVAGIVFFAVTHRSADSYLANSNVDRFWGEGLGSDRVALIEEWDETIGVRLGLISHAQDSIDTAYHSLHSGLAADVFLGSLLEAADGGVHVRILMDGIFHGLYGSMWDVRYALQKHPNVEFRFYEPFDLLRPWTWQNLLHDKLLIVDGKVGIISGRNMANRFYMPDYMTKDVVFDRDVAVIQCDHSLGENSGVTQMKEYFDLLWDHPYTANPVYKIGRKRNQRAETRREYFAHQLNRFRSEHPEYFFDAEAWLGERSVPTSKVTLIHNPIQRGNKTPWVWVELARLAEQAEASLLVQSPYLVPTQAMLKYLDKDSLAGKELVLLTNSVAASPNLSAIAGYERKRGLMENLAAQIWEYNGPGSLHGKALVFDHHISAVGSFNIDARSSFLSTETMLVIHSEEFNTLLRQAIKNKMEQSRPVIQGESDTWEGVNKAVSTIPWSKRAVVSLLRIFSGIFDFLL